jgi:CubicO group peptidase (beta-lactamase class C family)
MVPAIDELFSGRPEVGDTHALVVLRSGEVSVERYGEGTDAATTLASWSMAKSMLHAVVGMLVEEGRLDLDAPAPVPEWSAQDDPRRVITLRDLMVMRSGLRWVEDPAEGQRSDVVDMVYGVVGPDGRRGPQSDTGAFAAGRPWDATPGSTFVYSSGSSAIVSRIVGDVVGHGDAYRSFLDERLFGPVGMTSASPRFDPAGNWMASSFCFCTARDFARFGELYLRGGTVQGRQLVPADWVRTAATETARDDRGRVHTCHWWMFGDNPWGAFHASGWLGQYIVVVPPLDLVVVRLGHTPDDRGAVEELLTEVIASFDA